MLSDLTSTTRAEAFYYRILMALSMPLIGMTLHGCSEEDHPMSNPVITTTAGRMTSTSAFLRSTTTSAISTTMGTTTTTVPLREWRDVGSLTADLRAKDSEFVVSGPGRWLTYGDSKPQVVFVDGHHGSSATVASYNGASWDIVGKPGFSQKSIRACSMAVDPPSGAKYVAVADEGPGFTVFMFQKGTWTSLGDIGTESNGVMYSRTNVAVIGGAPHVVQIVLTNPLCQPTKSCEKSFRLWKYDFALNSWWTVGGTPLGVSFIDAEIDFISQDSKFGGVETYVALSKNQADGQRDISVLTWGGSSPPMWSNLGTTFQIARGNGLSLALKHDSGLPILAFQDSDNNGRLTVMSFDWGVSGQGVWTALGGPGSASVDAVRWPSLVVTSSGTPVVAYSHASAAGGEVVMWNQDKWTPLGKSGDISSLAGQPMSLALDSAGTPYLAWTAEKSGVVARLG